MQAARVNKDELAALAQHVVDALVVVSRVEAFGPLDASDVFTDLDGLQE